MLSRINESRSWRGSVAAIIACLVAASAAAQTAREVRGAAAVAPLQDEPPAKIIIDPPLAEPLSHGRVVIQYRTENLHMVPVFGSAALGVSPRVGHIHVSLDEQGIVKFIVPETLREERGAAAVQPLPNGPQAKIIINPLLAEPLSRGVVFIRYRTENLHIVPVFGSAALAVSPRIGHIQVTVDDAPWHWADASGGPIIINGLAPGRRAKAAGASRVSICAWGKRSMLSYSTSSAWAVSSGGRAPAF